MTPAEIAAENIRRNNTAAETYDPVTGRGAHGHRVSVTTPVEGLPAALVPVEMTEDPDYSPSLDSRSWRMLRFRHDFEYWCVSCVAIKPKDGYRNVAFRLNRAQRKVLAALEEDRLAGRPMRIIVLKARQWGCSTLIQNYMAWIQLCIRPGWSSLICCHKKDCAVNIRRLYTDLIAGYPAGLADTADGSPLRFRPFEGSVNVREIAGRGCRIAVASSDNQDAIRGYDIAMAHLSEAAFWRDSAHHSPDDIIRSVCGSVALLPYTLIAMESTANGTGNFFHEEWQRAVAGLSDKRPVFVAWHEIEMNAAPLDCGAEEFAATLTDSERALWNAGCTLEQINWYRLKARAYKDIRKLHAEYPSTDTEAFAATNCGVFDQTDIDRQLARCREPARRCRVAGERIYDRAGGELEIWDEPATSGDYIVSVDIGGRSATSDWSVIAVMRRGDPSTAGRHEIVAQWRGHTDHDILVDIARVIAERYNDALLIIESNTLETEANAGAGANAYVLDRLAASYPNLYRRRCGQERSESGDTRIGFHTNRATKVAAINCLIRALREDEYSERSAEACYEYSVYRLRPNGSYGAVKGHHDDIVMTRALAIYAVYDTQPSDDVPRLSAINKYAW